MLSDQMDKTVPGGAYLCQIKEKVSCGACCGLYNVADASRENLAAVLKYRTEKFAGVPRDMDAILKFREEIEAREDQSRPFPDFHHCPYVGLIGKARSRVGCLLHPLADGNNDTDFRGLSFYGGMACGMYFCPSCRVLPKTCKQIIREIADDWYSYGLLITEWKMIRAFFEQAEKRLGRTLAEDDLGNKELTEAIREFAMLKPNWRFRPESASPANYFFDDGLYPKPAINYDALGVSGSEYDVLLRELASEFDSADELHEAENLLTLVFRKFGA